MNANAFLRSQPYHTNDEASGLNLAKPSSISASAATAAFATSEEGQIGLIPLDATGPQKDFATLSCHKGAITDIKFRNAVKDDGIFATASSDRSVSGKDVKAEQQI